MTSIDPIRTEIRTYIRELPRLLAEGQEGRHVLIKGDEVVSIWDTADDCYQAGCERFGIGVPFLSQEIDSKYLDMPWPSDLLPQKAG